MIPQGSLPVIGCVAASIAVGALLRAAPDRPSVAPVVPVLWTWGLLALLAAVLSDRPLGPGGLRIGPGGLILLAAAVRLPLVGVPLLLSDDVYRFLWEGKVLSHGMNPFVLAPDAIAGLDDALRSKVNHPSIPSIYPPIALVWFRCLDALGLGPLGAQALGLLCDLASVWAIHRFLADRARPSWPALLFALHPLAAVEGTAGGHLETPAICLALLGLAADARAPWRAGLSAFLTGLAAGFKLVPLFWWPSTVRSRAAFAGAALAAFLGLLSVLSVLSAGPALFTAWHRYATEWRFDGFLFPWLALVVGDHARAVLLILASAGAIWALRAKTSEDTWLRIGSAFVLLSPTVHPWYVLWALVPSLLLARWEWAVAAVFLQGSYLVLHTLQPDGTWNEGSWLWIATWGPSILFLGWHWRRGRNPAKVPSGGPG
jgi:hypothetical protein